MRECEIDEFVQFLTEPIAEALRDYMAPDEFTDALMAVKSNIFSRLQETAQREPLTLKPTAEPQQAQLRIFAVDDPALAPSIAKRSQTR